MKPANISMKQAVAIGLFLGSMIAASAVQVTYQINMSVQKVIGNFNPGAGDTVAVAGNWNSWGTNDTLAVSVDTNIYTITLNQTAGIYPNYKFIINPGGNSASGSWKWESPSSFGGGNRWFQVPATDTNLPVVYYSDVTNAPAYQVQITFQLNMEVPIIQNIFTPGSSYVEAHGSFNGWSTTGVLLTNSPGTSNYLGTFTTTNLSLGASLAYKYVINGQGGTWEGNVGPGGTSDRVFTLSSTNQILPLDYWNNITNASLSFPVTFQVDMLVEYVLGNFTPGSDALFVNGTWDWSGSAKELFQTANPYVYTGTVALAYSPGTLIDYKYAMNGGIPLNSWEINGVGPGGGNNRQFTLSATNLPMDYFNNLMNLGPLYISGSGAQTVLSWPSGTNANNHIRLQNATNLLGGWVDVPNTQGQSAVTNDFGPAPVFFRLIGP